MSRNAIKGSMPINGKDAELESSKIISCLKDKLGVDGVTLGSTGKKPVQETSGDIDIAINMAYIPENIDKVKNWLYETYGKDVQIYISAGFKIISFGLTYKSCANEEEKYAQVDLMFSTNLEYSQFMYHSPNYKNNESKFKGLYRTNLLVNIAGRIPTGIEDTIADKVVTDYWKFSLSYSTGLSLVHKTFRGKRKLLSKAVTVKDDTVLITQNIDEIIAYSLGTEATRDTVNSFESLMSYLLSDKYPYGSDVVLNILNDYLTDERQQPMIKEIYNYILSLNISKDYTNEVKYIYSEVLEADE